MRQHTDTDRAASRALLRMHLEGFIGIACIGLITYLMLFMGAALGVK